MDLELLILKSLKESIVISIIIFILMIVVEFLVLKYKDKIINLTKKKSFLTYIIASLFGSIPGCVGTFAMDSLYMAGLLSFGGIIATMISTSGDEAFLMISYAIQGSISWTTLGILVGVLFLLGVVGAYLADVLKNKTKMNFCKSCLIEFHKNKEFEIGHFIKKHVFNHIIKKHIWKIFLWIFGALFVIGISKTFIDPQQLFGGGTMVYVLLVASLVGLLPLSGPNIFLIVLFSQGLIPFSVLLANSIIQDGHGLLPIIGFSVDDAVKIKLFNFFFGLIIGLGLLFLGF
jgi:hypothetical protein